MLDQHIDESIDSVAQYIMIFYDWMMFADGFEPRVFMKIRCHIFCDEFKVAANLFLNWDDYSVVYPQC